MTTQDLFELALAELVHAHRLRLAIDRRFSNVGNYRVLPKDSFKPVLAFEFAWQADHLKITDVQPPGALPAQPTYRVAGDLDELKSAIGRFLNNAGWATP